MSFFGNKRRDIVSELTEFPPMEAGAPAPLVLTNDFRLALAYYLADAPPSPTGYDTVHIRDPVADAAPAIFVKIEGFSAIKFGYPNDEALAGHRLYARGLKACAVSEVKEPSWRDELEQANRVHYNHRPDLFDDLRHIIFTFHDTTLEILCSKFEFEIHRQSVFGLLPQMQEFVSGR